MTDSTNEQYLLDVAQSVLDQVSRSGVDQSELSISATRGFSVTARDGDVEKIEHNNSHGLVVTVYSDTHKGSATASDFSQQSISDLVATAARIAKYTGKDDCARLADADLMATEFPDLGLDNAWDLTVDNAIDMAISCEDEMRQQKDIVNTDGADVSTARSTVCYANTHGFSHAYAGTQHGCSAVAVAGNNGSLQRDYWYSSACCADDLESCHDVGNKAAQRAKRRLGARRPKTCKAPVLFEAPVAASLLSSLISAIHGNALYRKTSFLLDTLGEQIFPQFMQIEEQPHLHGAMGSSPFDAEGVATYPHTIVHNGILESYVLDSYSARKLGMQTTANAGGVHNLVVGGEMHDMDTVLGAMGTGLFVVELIGQGVNLVTGDYSRGAFGFWVENGKVQYPVEEVTIAGNLKDMFLNISMLADDVDKRGNIRCGSVLVDGMIIAG